MWDHGRPGAGTRGVLTVMFLFLLLFLLTSLLLILLFFLWLEEEVQVESKSIVYRN